MFYYYFIWYRVAAFGLVVGIISVFLLFCFYRVFCLRNYG